MRNRNAFTLIEVLIVVIIMAVLAATIIPQFSSSTTDAKESSLKFNLHTIRSQIEVYKAHHSNKVPTDHTTFATQMTGKTKIDGTSDPNGDYGPYVQGEIPENPLNGSNAIIAVAAPGVEPTAVADAVSGWQYDKSTGDFYPNNAEWYPAVGG